MRTFLGLALCAAVGLAGCGDDTGSFDGAMNLDLAGQDLSSAMNSDLAGTHLVTVSPNGTLTFAPAALTIPHGDTVFWQWNAGSHTVTSGSGGSPDGKFCSGAPSNPSVGACSAEGGHPAGFQYEHTFPTAGTFPYFCNVHGATMAGTITVN